MIKLYGLPVSTNVSKVRYALNSLGLEYELIPTSPMSGETQSEEYGKISPTRKIPAIDVDGFTLFESNSILRYLASREKSELYPSNLEQRATVDAWMDYSSIHVSSAVGRIAFNRVFAPTFGMEVDEKSITTGLEFLDKQLPVVEKQLSENTYIAGNDLSIADISLFASLDMIEVAQIEIGAYTNLVKWREGLKAQDFYQKCYKDYTTFAKEQMSVMAS
ncbi:MAG: glutathione S-transferase [Lysobacterales bacterium]|jgi:glutathione S-transferase